MTDDVLPTRSLPTLTAVPCALYVLHLLVPQTLVFDYPTVSALSGFISASLPAPDQAMEGDFDPTATHGHPDSGLMELHGGAVLMPPGSHLPHQAGGSAEPAPGRVVAVVGASSRSPGRALEQLHGGDAIAGVPLSRWDVDALGGPAAAQLHARFGGWLAHVDEFDGAAFGISTPEALLMDPQHRLLLQAAHQAMAGSTPLAASGCGSDRSSGGGSGSILLDSSAAVAVGIASAEYSNYVARRCGVQPSAYGATGGALSVASGRLSYLYGFMGPSASVDTVRGGHTPPGLTFASHHSRGRAGRAGNGQPASLSTQALGQRAPPAELRCVAFHCHALIDQTARCVAWWACGVWDFDGRRGQR